MNLVQISRSLRAFLSIRIAEFGRPSGEWRITGPRYWATVVCGWATTEAHYLWGEIDIQGSSSPASTAGVRNVNRGGQEPLAPCRFDASQPSRAHAGSRL